MADHEKIDPFRSPEGPFQKRKVASWGMLAAAGGILVAMLVWQGGKKAPEQQQPTTPPPVVQPPGLGNRPSGGLERDALKTGQPPPPQNGAPELTPEEQRRQQLIDKRREMELRSAFASSVVSVEHRTGPVPVPSQPEAQQQASPVTPNAPAKKEDPLAFSPDQPLYTMPEHTVIPAFLDSRIEGEMSGPLDAIVSMNVYLPNSHVVVIPAGAKLVGDSKGVTNLGQQRLAVSFHRVLIYPKGAIKPYAISLDETPGEDQVGGAGLHDKVNNHYASIFGASLAIGLISGLSELGSYSRNNYSSQYGFYNGVSVASGQNAMRVLDRFLNRLPTVEIRQGTRMIVETIQDLQVPAYAPIN